MPIDNLVFLSADEVAQIAARWGTPLYVYDEATILRQAALALAFQAPFGLTVRFAMKANPNPAILEVLDEAGVRFDASSGYEAEVALRAAISPDKLMITTQEMPKKLAALGKLGVKFNASSLHQLEEFGKLFPSSCVGVRINPGIGSGHSHKTTTAGPNASFGIWHEYIPEMLDIARRWDLTIYRIHTHVGSGADPTVWLRASELSLRQISHLPDVTHLDLGGGFKVRRMSYEEPTDLQAVSKVVAEEVRKFHEQSGRQLHLEIEPGTFLVANAGSLLTTIQDMSDTGPDGYRFLKLDCGMDGILRPSLYGAQHPMVVVNDSARSEEYVVVGHCCEAGDLLTPSPNDPENLEPRLLGEAAIGDRLVIEGVGAYCAHMSAHGYNSFPVPREIMRREEGGFVQV